MKNGMQRTMRLAVLAVLFSAPAQAAYVELPNGTKVEGTDIRAKSDGEIVLTTAQGQRTFSKGQYVRAVADKPADFDRARQLVAAKKADEALPILVEIVRKNRYLGWDVAAQQIVAQAQAVKGDHAAAALAYEELFRLDPEKKADPAIGWAHRQALLNAKQFDKLGPVLDDLIEKGSRADAAKAQTMRGDIKLAQGQVDGAVLDYLRTVVLFENEKEAQPEALFKAGEALEKLRDPRAKSMFEKLRTEYAASPFAAQAAGK